MVSKKNRETVSAKWVERWEGVGAVRLKKNRIKVSFRTRDRENNARLLTE